ncbi:phasin family protein [Roseibium sediminis]|uniref:phasin family protein n=1 Tax=Roseibium sediminis TaxID=1775174 RepID=UPI00123DD7ED|nr:phasin family protein [Roseibium sediminis]
MAVDKTGFEVPEQMRDMAEKSVDQARKAFDEFMSVTQKAVAQAEESASAVQSGAGDMQRKSLSYAEEHIDAAFNFARSLVKATDMEQVVALQQDFMRKQMEALGEQSRDLSDRAVKAAQDAGKATKS